MRSLLAAPDFRQRPRVVVLLRLHESSEVVGVNAHEASLATNRTERVTQKLQDARHAHNDAWKRGDEYREQ